MTIQIKRVYEDPAPSDGYRVLVDRLWPRGMRKDALDMDEWDTDVTPSTQLREQWHHGLIDTATFQERYAAELEGNPGVSELVKHAQLGPVTLLVATRDVATSHAHVLVAAIEKAGPRT